MLAELVLDGIHGLCQGCLPLPICFFKEKHLASIVPEDLREKHRGA